jgi:hypothetical protein
MSTKSMASRPCPPDARLAALTRLLDDDEAAALLRRSSVFSIDEAEIVAIRYKPRRRLVVEYAVTTGRERRTAVALLDSKADLRGLARAPGIAFDEATGALVQWWPFDVALPQLADAGDAERLGYKPFARATLRLGERVAKLYASRQKWRRAVAALARVTEAGVSDASLEGVAEAECATVQRFVSGAPVEGARVAQAAAALLRRVHVLSPQGFPRRDAALVLEDASKSLALAATILPAVSRRLERVRDTLARTLPEETEVVTAHGDFEPGQLLEGDQGLTVVDVDDMCVAPAALDLGRYAAHAVRGDDGDITAVDDVLERLVAGYGSRPHALDWFVAAAIASRAAAPFRSHDTEWPTRVEAIVGAAERKTAAL